MNATLLMARLVEKRVLVMPQVGLEQSKDQRREERGIFFAKEPTVKKRTWEQRFLVVEEEPAMGDWEEEGPKSAVRERRGVARRRREKVKEKVPLLVAETKGLWILRRRVVTIGMAQDYTKYAQDFTKFCAADGLEHKAGSHTDRVFLGIMYLQGEAADE